MATIYQDSVAHGGFHPWQGLSSWFFRKIAIWTENRRRARDVRDLAQFSDRELWDMGLSRSDLMAIERGLFTRD